MKKITGFNEKYGIELDKYDYMNSVMRDVAVNFGYGEIVLPVLEDARSYSEEVVGESPWPEWNERGCFFFSIDNYTEDYNYGNPQRVVLIPEGTVSVTRWLANRIESGMKSGYPIKLFYSMNCYRNELLCSLSKTKRREFKQFGLEILGSSSKQSDAEIIYVIGRILSSLGIPVSSIRIRMNDIRIFLKLKSECNISEEHTLKLKSLLDEIAEARAKKCFDELSDKISCAYDVLNNYPLSEIDKKRWTTILEHTDYELGGFIDVFDNSYKEYFDTLIEFRSAFEQDGFKIDIDPCVIRSHEYYTGLSFEVDVNVDGRIFAEIAGGGRYDRLVGKFLNSTNESKIPCTGFAFGVERVFELLDSMRLFEKDIILTKKYYFSSLIQEIILPDSSVSGYVTAVRNTEQYPVNIIFKEK